MDKISKLPDELIAKVLTFLPTKEAVSTSILSKRWEHLWMWLPKLEYDDQHYSESERKRLRCFIVRSLPLHKAHVIESLRLKLSNSHYFKPQVIKWIVATAVSRKYVSWISLTMITPEFLDDWILLAVCLPSLRTLQLQQVAYFNEEYLQRLLSNCPALEELKVDIWVDDNTRKFTITVPSLQRLSLFIPFDYGIDGLVIKTPSLKYFKLRVHSSSNHYCLVEHMPNLIEAYLDVEFPNIKSLIESITSVKCLEICSERGWPGGVERASASIRTRVRTAGQAIGDAHFDGTIFRQLEQLKVCTCETTEWLDLLMRLLKAAPKLRFIVLELSKFHGIRTGDPILAGTNRVVFLNDCCLLLNILTGGNTEEQKKRNKWQDTS
ncbi:hypothetical protein F2Q68_00021852 [Brassica cretica]|uniref:F-box domain-containing protein n=1 Tax=Brassica cretica TaxID=69181 RepID=A0A8S9FT04_BRACR|nr:hypothetical protein F2Q68_00021852 [Brassica cretica]